MTYSIPFPCAAQPSVCTPFAQSIQPACHRRIYWAVRRSAELLFCFFACVPLGILIPLLWVANWFSAPGPLFYRQTRVGQHGRPFVMVKFRSMVVDAESNGAVWASVNDPRITPIGHFLRSTHLDELPQIWHVLLGEMSLIGPRPERPVFVATLTATNAAYAARHLVRPGITGWAQVQYHYAATVEDALIKLNYDLAYIQQQNLVMDGLILWRTIGAMCGVRR